MSSDISKTSLACVFNDVHNEYWSGTEPYDVPVPVFKGFKTLIWSHHKLMRESKIPFPTMFITCSLLLLILKLKEYQDYLLTGKMFTPVNKTSITLISISESASWGT